MHGSMIPVLSSNIDGYRYLDDQCLLLIAFKSGMTYAYKNVPDFIVLDFVDAPSKGNFFHKFIRDIYPFFKLDPMALENVLAGASGVLSPKRQPRPPSLTFSALQVKHPVLAAMF